MKVVTAILCGLIPLLAISQNLSGDNQKFLHEHLQKATTERLELKEKFKKYDYSCVWLYDQKFLFGFIGNNYQRLYMRFLEIKRSSTDPFIYEVQGKSRVKNNINDFTGEIKILHVREIDVKERAQRMESMKLYHGDDLDGKSKYRRYMILAEYVFREDPKQKFSGEFKGSLKSTFFIRNDSVQFDNIYFFRDTYDNNQFVGTWSMYEQTIVKRCCLGYCRIPYSGDLNIGAAEFSPDKKYLKYGWESYSKAVFGGDQEASKEEERKWWE